MTDDTDDDAKALLLALEEVITGARAMGWSRVVASAEHAAALWVKDPEDGAQDQLSDRPDVPEAKRTRLH